MASEKLKKFSENSAKFKVSYFEPIEIRDMVVKMKNKKLKEALDNYFLKSNV
jgi:hypothetical protein